VLLARSASANSKAFAALETLDVLWKQSDHLLVRSAPSALGSIGIATEHWSTAHRAALLGGVPSLFHHVKQGALALDAGIGDLDSNSQFLPGGSDTEQRTTLVVTAMHQPLALNDQLGNDSEMTGSGLKHLLLQPRMESLQRFDGLLVLLAAHGAVLSLQAGHGPLHLTIIYYNATKAACQALAG